MTERKEKWIANAYSFEKLGIARTKKSTGKSSQSSRVRMSRTPQGIRCRHESMLEDTTGFRKSLVDSR
jgi:hypothetical protein